MNALCQIITMCRIETKHQTQHWTSNLLHTMAIGNNEFLCEAGETVQFYTSKSINSTHRLHTCAVKCADFLFYAMDNSIFANAWQSIMLSALFAMDVHLWNSLPVSESQNPLKGDLWCWLFYRTNVRRHFITVMHLYVSTIINYVKFEINWN